MLLFLNEDRSYLNWVTRHRVGFVIDCARTRGKRPMTLHRSNCSLIRQAKSKRTRWTTGNHMKGCSLDLDELRQWSLEQGGRYAELCQVCRPGDVDSDLSLRAPDRLTKLDQRIMSCILEIAGYHLEMEDCGYGVTVEMVAGLLGKSERQLSASLQRLVQDGLLDMQCDIATCKKFHADPRIFPTIRALRTLDEYATLDDEAIIAELQTLQNRSAKPTTHR